MNCLPAPLLIAVSVLGASAPLAHSRSYSFESMNCLFEIAKPPRAQSLLAFSFAPLAESLMLHSPWMPPARSLEVEPAPTLEPAQTAPSELTTTWTAPPIIQAPQVEPMEAWPMFDALRKFRDNPRINGLSHSFSNPNSVLALDYSDIFETGRAPYKGGHGVSLFFRHAF